MANWRKIKSRKLKPREGGGISICGFGFSRPKANLSQQDMVREIVDWLDSRRALSDVYVAEGEWYVNSSLGFIRDYLVDWLPRLDRDDVARTIVKDWIQECNEHLTEVPDPDQGSMGLRPHVQESLDIVRQHFNAGLNDLAREYGVPEAEDLARKIHAGSGWY